MMSIIYYIKSSLLNVNGNVQRFYLNMAIFEADQTSTFKFSLLESNVQQYNPYKIEMNREENDSSQQQQGFYKPQLKVVQSNESSPPQAQKPQQFANEANDLVLYNRPTDYLPRVLSVSPPIYEQLIDLNLEVVHPRQQLFGIHRQKIKKCKYLSLKDKYKANELYKLVYSKIDPSLQFNQSIFSLNHTTDYNPNNYQQIRVNQSGNIGKFQSRFQSGNLNYAYLCLQSKIQQYDLILQNDTNTKGYNQWFYFSFKNQSSKSVRFNIVNLIKKHSLFEEGVRPVGFSTQHSQKGWHSIGTAIDYQKTYVSRQISSNPPIYKNYYTLSFTVEFQCQNDVFYIALNYPYTYTRMIKFINDISENNPQIIVDKSIVAYTISNNAVPLVKLKHAEYIEGGKKILIMGRQHPGETVGSFVLEGFIKNLLKQTKLFKTFQVIVIPMMNPDGVIYGNFRTNLAGFDLNRQWIEPNKWLHPQIFYVSRYVSGLENISFVIDFHGHSKKYNSFIYACTGQSPYLFRVFPYICAQESQLFSLKDCTYNITFDKQKTARVKLYRQVKKPHVFTLQTSFFGYSDQNNKRYRYQISDLYLTGQKISQSLKLFFFRKKQLLQYEKQVKEKQYLFDQWSFQNRDDVDSQSNPSEDQLTPVQRKQKVLSQKIKKKKKSHSKTKKKKSAKEQKNTTFFMNLEQNKKKQVHEQRRQPVSQQRIKPPIPERPAQIVSKKKSESVRLVHFNEVKVNKKIHKALAVISPPPPENSAPNIIPLNVNKAIEPKVNTSSTFNLKSNQKVKQFELPPPPLTNDRKIKEETSPQPINPSNLFNTTNFYGQIHQKLKKQQKRSNLHQKTQSLQISNIKKQMIFPKGNALNVLRRLISNEDDQQQKQLGLDPSTNKLKHKQIHFLNRQNKIINTLTKIQQKEMKRNLQQQINNRTEALKNCQKKMRQMSLDEPILRTNQQLSLLQTTGNLFYINSTPKTYKFPTIRMDKKLDYFNF